MANGHGGKRKGAKRPSYPFKTKEIRWRVTGFDYTSTALKGESYDDFFSRIELAAYEAIRVEMNKKRDTKQF